MDFIETLEVAKLVGGLLVTFTGIVSGLVYWFHRRMATVATDATEGVAAAQAHAKERHDGLVEDMDRLAARVEDMSRELSRFRERLNNVEIAVRATPSRDDIHNLTLSMANMEGHLGRLEEKLVPVAAIMERMQDLLMRPPKEKA